MSFNIEKDYEDLKNVLRDTEKDLINQIQENNVLREEIKGLKTENKRLKEENSKLGLEEIKANYEKEIEKLRLELERTKDRITLQTKPREITDEQVQEIKDLRNLGLSYREISEKTKWSKFTIGRVLKGVYDN